MTHRESPIHTHVYYLFSKDKLESPAQNVSGSPSGAPSIAVEGGSDASVVSYSDLSHDDILLMINMKYW